VDVVPGVSSRLGGIQVLAGLDTPMQLTPVPKIEAPLGDRGYMWHRLDEWRSWCDRRVVQIAQRRVALVVEFRRRCG
jgi:hypothetical protein